MITKKQQKEMLGSGNWINWNKTIRFKKGKGKPIKLLIAITGMHIIAEDESGKPVKVHRVDQFGDGFVVLSDDRLYATKSEVRKLTKRNK